MLTLPWHIIGGGRVGQSLALFANHHGIEVQSIWNRTGDRSAIVARNICATNFLSGDIRQYSDLFSARSAVFWLTVADDAISDVFSTIESSIASDSIVFHTSGSLNSEILKTTSRKDILRASLHPLQAITDPDRAVQGFSGSSWTVEGDDRAIRYAREMLALIEVEPLQLRSGAEEKVLYHAAAVTAANLLVSLLDASIGMATNAGLERDQAQNMLVKLAQSSVENLRHQTPKNALSGPVARGDMATIERHRKAIKNLSNQSLQEIYDALTAHALDLINNDKS